MTDAFVRIGQEIADAAEVATMEYGPHRAPAELDGTGTLQWKIARQAQEVALAAAVRTGRVTAAQSLYTATLQALSQDPNSPELRHHLIILAAVCTSWAEGLDARAEGRADG